MKNKTVSCKRPQIIVSAGDAITAKLIEKAGFDGIWVSGFESCARLGLPDNGSITMTEMLSIVKPIVDSVNLPVWVDCDTGYQNFKRTVAEFEKIGVYCICVEDNMPEMKQNSLWGGKIPLMDMEEFGKKINVPREKIKIMARTEALIRGYGSKEARERIRHYQKSGADYILPHARMSKDILRVSMYTKKNMAIVPTMFPFLTNRDFSDLGYSVIIWANQTERVKIKAVKKCLESIKLNECAGEVEKTQTASIKELRSFLPIV